MNDDWTLNWNLDGLIRLCEDVLALDGTPIYTQLAGEWLEAEEEMAGFDIELPVVLEGKWPS